MLDISITYELVACTDNDEPNPIIDVSGGAIVAKTVPDYSPEATFVVDHSKLTNWYKTVPSAKIALTNGMIQKVTYQVKDHAQDIVGAATIAKYRDPNGSEPCTEWSVADVKLRMTKLRGRPDRKQYVKYTTGVGGMPVCSNC